MQFRKILPWVGVPVIALAVGLGAGTIGKSYLDGRGSSGHERAANQQQGSSYETASAQQEEPYKSGASQQASASSQATAVLGKTFDFGSYIDEIALSAPSYIVVAPGETDTKFSHMARKDAIVYVSTQDSSPYTAVYTDSQGVNDTVSVFGGGVRRDFSTAERQVDVDVTRINKPTATKFLDMKVDGDKVIYAIARDGKIYGRDENIGVTGDGVTPLHSVQVWVYNPKDDTRKGIGSYDTFDFDSSVWIGNIDRDAATEIVLSTSSPVRTFVAEYNHVSNRKDVYTEWASPSRSKSALQVYEININGLVRDYGILQEVDGQLKELRSSTSADGVKTDMDGSSPGTRVITAMVLAGNQLQSAIDAEASQRVQELGADARAQIFKATFQALMGDPSAVLSIIEANKYKDLANINIASSGFYSSPDNQSFNGTTGSVYDPSTTTYRTGGVDLPKNLIPNDIKTGLDRGVLTPDQITTLNNITSKYKSTNSRTGSSSSSNSSSGNGSMTFDYTVPHGDYDPAKDPFAGQKAQQREQIEQGLRDFNKQADEVSKGLNETAGSINDFLSGLLDDKKK